MCVLCRRADVPLAIHHIKPKALGGSDEFSNLVMVCASCNHLSAGSSFEKVRDEAQASYVLEQATAAVLDAANFTMITGVTTHSGGADIIATRQNAGSAEPTNLFVQCKACARAIDARDVTRFAVASRDLLNSVPILVVSGPTTAQARELAHDFGISVVDISQLGELVTEGPPESEST